MKLAVIPARGGSKRIPRKNVREFCGKPMIAWSIEAAFGSGCFDRVVVSTDDPEIAKVAEAYGADVPFVRPANLAGDFTPTIPVIAHAVRWHQDQGLSVDLACCIYATAPFIEPADIQVGLELLQQGDWNFVFAATSFAAPVHRAFTQQSGGGLSMLFPEHFESRSQDLPECLHDAGQFYWGHARAWLQFEKMFDQDSTIVRLPRWRVHDIDTLEDWERAERLLAAVRDPA